MGGDEFEEMGKRNLRGKENRKGRKQATGDEFGTASGQKAEK